MPPETNAVDAKQDVDRVMRLWPDTIRVFLAHRMLCVGCPVGRLHTIEDACAAHGVELRGLLDALERVARKVPPRLQEESGAPSAISRSL